MDNFNLKKYLAENKLEEEYIGQFGSQSEQDLAMAKAKFSNAILALDSDNMETAKLAEEAYLMLGNVLKAHLDERFNR
jgi:hypothetical protein|tara:strand:- start:221 stop:454 length:234 start_codon:yes stop_codon:yes gene_type:complete